MAAAPPLPRDPVALGAPVLFVRDVVAASPCPSSPHVALLAHRPVHIVELAGVVVSRLLRDTHVVFGLDDGTAVVECVIWLPRQRNRTASPDAPPPVEWAAFRRACAAVDALGRVVRVRGKVAEFRGQRQVTVSAVQRLADPHMELVHWRDARLGRTCAGADAA